MATVAPQNASSISNIIWNKLRNWWHVVFWMLFSADELLSIFGLTPPLDGGLQLYLATLVPVMALAYFNLWVLVPKLLRNGKFGWYFLAVSGCILVFPFVQNFIEQFYIGAADCETCRQGIVESVPEKIGMYIFQALEGVFVVGTTTSLKLFQDLVVAQKRIDNLENKKLQAELNFLKAQINPHFLFNSINNIYVLTRVDPPKASEVVLKFSDLLSYQLYECAKEKVLLHKEIAYLHNFIELHRIRKENAQIKFHINGDPGSILVSPMLFITFLENAFKHGNSIREDGYIDVSMEISNAEIVYKVVNSKGDPIPFSESSGLGLENTVRRLELLFPSKHQLDIQDLEDSFEVTLRLEL